MNISKDCNLNEPETQILINCVCNILKSLTECNKMRKREQQVARSGKYKVHIIGFRKKKLLHLSTKAPVFVKEKSIVPGWEEISPGNFSVLVVGGWTLSA